MIIASREHVNETTNKGCEMSFDIDQFMREARERIATFDQAVATIDRMTTDPDKSDDPYRPNTVFDGATTALRDMLCEGYEYDTDEKWGYASYGFTPEMHAELLAAFNVILNLENEQYAREWLTTQCLAYSVCPMHRCDYQACFDDDDPECASIRIVHPSHDT